MIRDWLPTNALAVATTNIGQKRGLRNGSKVGPRKGARERAQVGRFPKVDEEQTGVHQPQRGHLQQPWRHLT